MNIFKEALLEPPARWLRIKACFSYLPKRNFVLLDLGSGPDCILGKKLFGKCSRYIAIDPLLDTGSLPKDWRLIKKKINTKIGLPNNSVDVIVSTAFIEHVDHPREIMKEAMRILNRGGKLILTTPTPLAKNLLEFLSFRLGWISKREIAEHKNYFDKKSLIELVAGIKPKKIEHRYFELGLNNLLVVTK